MGKKRFDKNELLKIEDSYTEDTKHLIRFLDERNLELDYEGLQAYVSYLKGAGYAAATINKRISGAKNRLRLLFGKSSESMDVLSRYQMETVLKEIKGMKLTTKGVDIDKTLSLEEIKKLLASESTPERVKLFIEFLVVTGTRASEMAGIRLAHLKEEPEYVSIRLIGKGNKERFLKVFPDLVNRIRACFKGNTYLFETRKGNLYRRQNISDAIARAGRTVLSRKISAHTLRHTFATLQIQKSRKVKAVSIYLGHSTTSITQDMYVHEELDIDDLKLNLKGKKTGESE